MEKPSLGHFFHFVLLAEDQVEMVLQVAVLWWMSWLMVGGWECSKSITRENRERLCPQKKSNLFLLLCMFMCVLLCCLK